MAESGNELQKKEEKNIAKPNTETRRSCGCSGVVWDTAGGVRVYRCPGVGSLTASLEQFPLITAVNTQHQQ